MTYRHVIGIWKIRVIKEHRGELDYVIKEQRQIATQVDAFHVLYLAKVQRRRGNPHASV